MSNQKILNRGESEYDMDMSSYQQFPMKVQREKRASKSGNLSTAGSLESSAKLDLEQNHHITEVFCHFFVLFGVICISLYRMIVVTTESNMTILRMAIPGIRSRRYLL